MSNLLTTEDKLRIIKLAEERKALFFDGGIRKWIESDKEYGHVYSDERGYNGEYFTRIWFEGLFYQCNQYWDEAIKFYNHCKQKYETQKLKDYE